MHCCLCIPRGWSWSGEMQSQWLHLPISLTLQVIMVMTAILRPSLRLSLTRFQRLGLHRRLRHSQMDPTPTSDSMLRILRAQLIWAMISCSCLVFAILLVGEIACFRVIPTMTFQNSHVRFLCQRDRVTRESPEMRPVTLNFTDWLEAIFWHSFWHIFWHCFWHSFWHISWQSVWHAFWYIFWHSVWHSFWHSPDSLSGMLSDISSDILSDILSDLSCDILSGIFFWHSFDILSEMSSDILADISSDILSDIRSRGRGPEDRGWGPAGNTGRRGSWLRSGREHWPWLLSVEVWQRTLETWGSQRQRRKAEGED